MSVILGIDPGKTGAMVWLDTLYGILTIMDNEEWANPHDPAAALHDILSLCKKTKLVCIEAQHTRATYDASGKRKQGLASTWTYAEHYGTILGCLAALQVPVHKVEPAVWKALMHLDKDKKKSLELARKLWPNDLDKFKRIKDHGRAEAALLAEFGKRYLPVGRRVL